MTKPVKYDVATKNAVNDILNGGAIGRGITALVNLCELVGAPVMMQEPSMTNCLNTYLNAVHTELGELANELPTKPWNPSRQTYETKAAFEMADVIIMLGNVMWLMDRLDITPQFLSTHLAAKVRENMDRIERQMRVV